MKKTTLLFGILCLMLLAPVFGQTIDFTKRYTIDNIRGIAWQPGTDQYSYIDDDQNIILVNAKNGKETTFLAAASQKAHDISSPYGYEWLDANTLYFPRDNKTVNVLKGKITTSAFDKVDADNVIDQDIKHGVFVIKNDKGVFVESALNGYKPVLLCPDTGEHIGPVHLPERQLHRLLPYGREHGGGLPAREHRHVHRNGREHQVPDGRTYFPRGNPRHFRRGEIH